MLAIRLSNWEKHTCSKLANWLTSFLFGFVIAKMKESQLKLTVSFLNKNILLVL